MARQRSGAEPTEEQPRLVVAALRDRDHPPQEKRRQPTHRDIRAAESAHRIAPIAPNAAAAAANMTTDCATIRTINGRNSTASFLETDEGTSPPPATSNATGRHSWAGWGRVSVRVRAVWRGGLSSSTCWRTARRSRATNSSTRRSMTNKVGGEGRAMVITNGIELTIRYFPT